MSVTFYFNDTVRKVYHKDGSLYHSFITHNIAENKFVSIYINTADVLEDYRIVIFFIYSCQTHNNASLFHFLFHKSQGKAKAHVAFLEIGYAFLNGLRSGIHSHLGKIIRHLVKFCCMVLIVQDQVWNRVTVNRAEKKATRYYMDEFHLLLKEEQTAAYSVEIWKRFRKWGGIPTAITQNVKDLLSSREVENIFENSDFVLMLNQAQGDRAILAKQLNISPQQMKYVTHTEAGEGLIFYGNVVLPFVDHFPKDTELYRIMTTKPEEVSSL